MESPAIRLRAYEPSDFETLVRIDQVCFPHGIAYSRTQMRIYLRSRDSRCVIAEAGSEVAGFILTEISKDRAHIITLDVLAAHRRKSIGSALLRAAERAVAEQGAARMVLETATTNKAAIALWKKHGYREIVTIKDYYAPGLDAYEMHKQLEPKSWMKAFS